MQKKKTKLQLSQERAEESIRVLNWKIDKLGESDSYLYNSLTELQDLFDRIRNVPSEQKLKYEKLKKIRLNWKQQATKIENDYNNAKAKDAGAGIAGVGAGVAVMAMGPTAAMGIATTFGVASTGTAISALSGAAATNAALAWLGGGALAAGGGGMAAGNLFLTMLGPVGWGIAGAALLGSGLLLLKNKSDKDTLENIFIAISKRDIKSYELAITELNERIDRIKSENRLLRDAIYKVRDFGLDYDCMTEEQQYTLGSYMNLMQSTTQLLVNPILGLMPKYTEKDYNAFVARKGFHAYDNKLLKYKDLIIGLANLLYKVMVNQKERKLLAKSFKGNKEFLESYHISKNDFDESLIDIAIECLIYKGRR